MKHKDIHGKAVSSQMPMDDDSDDEAYERKRKAAYDSENESGDDEEEEEGQLQHKVKKVSITNALVVLM